MLPVSWGDDDGAQQLDLGIENRRACGDFTILKILKHGVYRILTESGQTKEMTDSDIDEMINPSGLPRFCYMTPAYENRRIVVGKKLSRWVQPHVLQLEGFVETVAADSAVESDLAELVVAQDAPSEGKFNEWLGKEGFSLPWKKRALMVFETL